MSPLLRHLARYATRKIAADPRARQKAAEAARIVAEEARLVARDPDRARAAGRSVRRVMNRLKSER